MSGGEEGALVGSRVSGLLDRDRTELEDEAMTAARHYLAIVM